MTAPTVSHTAGVRRRIVVVVGATASGKTALSLALAARFSGEIVNADSRQIYRGMDIGTAKPTPHERATVPHHLIDIRTPDQPFSLAEFLALASATIAGVSARGHLPIVVGGTGQYVRALLHGWQAPAVPPDPALRAQLLAEAEARGGEALHAELAARDPAAAAAIDRRNVRRVVRALEVIHTSGRPFSEQTTRTPPSFDALTLGLAWPRDHLYRRIDQRVDALFAAGLVDEVRGLLAAGYSPRLPALQSIGYAQVCSFLAGDLTLTQAVERTKTGTHRLARSQGAWFRRSDPAIHWLEPANGPVLAEAEAVVSRFLADPAPSTSPRSGEPVLADPAPSTSPRSGEPER